MLPGLLLLLGLAQQPEPRLFLWTIIGFGEPGPNIVVTVTPTPFGLVSGVEVKAIALQPLPTRDDSKPRTIQPRKTEPAPPARKGNRPRLVAKGIFTGSTADRKSLRR